MNEIEPTENPRFYKWGLFYFNPDDERILVPKRIRSMGWTFNFAKPEVYHFVLTTIIIIWVTSMYS